MDTDLLEVAGMLPAFERYGRLSSQTTSARAMRAPFAEPSGATMRSGARVPRARRDWNRRRCRLHPGRV